jgi:hypothetical protein
VGFVGVPTTPRKASGGGCPVKYVTTYTFKPFMTKDETRTLLEAFAEFGSAPGTTAHFIRQDGAGGIVIGETDDIAALYRNTLNYAEFIEFESHVVLSVEDEVPLVAEYAG